MGERIEMGDDQGKDPAESGGRRQFDWEKFYAERFRRGNGGVLLTQDRLDIHKLAEEGYFLVDSDTASGSDLPDRPEDSNDGE